MSRNTNLSLSGSKNENLHSLINLGNTQGCKIRQPLEVIKIKSTIMKLIIIPFMSKNWKVLEENLVFFDNIKSKLTKIISRNKCTDLKIYQDIIFAFETAVFLHMEIKNLEEKLYGCNSNVSTLVFKTTMIRLKPELELYNLVFGRPNFKTGEKYNMDIVNNIIILLKTDNVTFDQIKNFVLNKYLNLK
jgi:hypothetical protein